MRKWMRERLQRRKKTPAEPADQPAPPPLQPAYFDAAEQPGPAPDPGHIASEVSAPSEPEARKMHSARSDPEEQAQADSAEQPAISQTASRPGQLNRSRRRRGGRGRGGRGREQAVAQAFAPAAVKGSIPGATVESQDEEPSDAAAAEAITPASSSVAASSAAPGVPAAAPRPPKGVVVLAIGLPGSGKSSWFKRHNVVPLSSDMVRSLLFDDVREQRFQDLVFSNLRSMLKARLIAKRPMNYVDATNLTPQERQHWIKLAKDYQYEVQAVFFDVPLEVCIERHQRRDRVVPEDVMRRMAAKLKPPAFEEGFAKITVVRVKKKEPEAG
jgi:predicted kinase